MGGAGQEPEAGRSDGLDHERGPDRADQSPDPVDAEQSGAGRDHVLGMEGVVDMADRQRVQRKAEGRESEHAGQDRDWRADRGSEAAMAKAPARRLAPMITWRRLIRSERAPIGHCRTMPPAMAAPIRSPTLSTDIPTSVPYTAPKPRMPPTPIPVTNDVATPSGAVFDQLEDSKSGEVGFRRALRSDRDQRQRGESAINPPATPNRTKPCGDPAPSSSWPRPYPALTTRR